MKLTLGPYKIPVVWHDGVIDEDCWGTVSFDDPSGIRIDVSRDHYDPAANLLHEAMHAVYELQGVRRLFIDTYQEETVVEATVHGVIELLRRNPKLVEMLVG